jgi:hypothetical protein
MLSKVVVQVVALVVVLTSAVLALIHGHAPRSAVDWLAPIGPAVAAAGTLLWAFDRYVWRWPGVRRLVGKPILDGTWHGELASRRVDPKTGERVPPTYNVFLVVRQRYWKVTARFFTKESSSESLTAELKRADDGVCQLVYVYRNTPRPGVRDHFPIHSGTVVLNAPKDQDDGLEGEYFTGRATTGELCFTQHFKRHIESYSAGLKLLQT